MADLKARLSRMKLFRRVSSSASAKSGKSTASDKNSLPTLSTISQSLKTQPHRKLPGSFESESLEHCDPPRPVSLPTPDLQKDPPVLTVQNPTPDPLAEHDQPSPLPTDIHPRRERPASGTVRRQSLVANANARVFNGTVDTYKLPATPESPKDYFTTSAPATFNANMLHRKIWVKRPGASATLVQIKEDDLVDDVRDMILKKYANSLGRSFDSPDVTMRIISRHGEQGHVRHHDRTLGPEEDMCRTLDAYFPGGQTVEEALLIDVPQRRTPKPSPRGAPHMPYHMDDTARPVENATDYFPPMPPAQPSPATLPTISHDCRTPHPAHERAMSVLNTGQVPALPSPGAARRPHHSRPKYPRQHTSSPTTMSFNAHPTQSATNVPRPVPRSRHDSSASESKHVPPAAPPLPTPPAPEAPPTRQTSSPSTPLVTSPRPIKAKKTRTKNHPEEHPLPAGLLESPVPPINVLLVEDNIINLKILEQFMGRLKVRWQTAMNGQAAVTKWRAGGFHLVLMDIQLPIMSGLEATKEIRRLERVNSIGVFSSASNEAPELKTNESGEVDGIKHEDRLGAGLLFKSPVIIVALTASSLQSDRHEALAAGCNDFLTKPVNFVWMERKVKEWGCMQALIDFDGWRKWKDFAAQNDASALGPKNLKSSTQSPPGTAAGPTTTKVKRKSALFGVAAAKNKEGEKEREREKEKERRSEGKEVEKAKVDLGASNGDPAAVGKEAVLMEAVES